MSFVLWYQVKIEEGAPAGGLFAAGASLLGLGLPVKVSNDIFSGSYILDADIVVTMTAGDAADTLEVTLTNLPLEVADLLKAKQADGVAADPPQPLRVKIYLGYFDEPSTTTGSQPVMEGAVTSIKTVVGDDGIARTQINGQEIGGYRLRAKCFSAGRPEQATADDFIRDIAEQTGVRVAPGSSLRLSLANFTLADGSALQALGRIAMLANAPLIIRDNTIHFGAAVGGSSDPAPVAFSPDRNIVKLEQLQVSEETLEPCRNRTNERPRAYARSHLEMTVLGHPGLRVGQKATVEDVAGTPQGTLRINHLVHRFSTKQGGGYTCDVKLLAAEPGELARGSTGAHGVVDRVRDVVESAQSQRPAIDVGQIREYQAGNQSKHLATLNYGQSPPGGAVAPSVETPVDEVVQLHNKPIASPFAFHKCGLIVPVYPKMRAWLAHNRNQVNDAIVAGFVWSENPVQARPENEPGDFWLCLPTELDTDGLPTGKGVNDLIDRRGLRVIQAKGLQILVASDQLPDVGARPAAPDENAIVIKHESGTSITIANDGGVTIETDAKDIALTNGSVTLKLSGAAVEVT